MSPLLIVPLDVFELISAKSQSVAGMSALLRPSTRVRIKRARAEKPWSKSDHKTVCALPDLMTLVVNFLGPGDVSKLVQTSRAYARFLLVSVLDNASLKDVRNGSGVLASRQPRFHRVYHWSTDVSRYKTCYHFYWNEWNAHHGALIEDGLLQHGRRSAVLRLCQKTAHQVYVL